MYFMYLKYNSKFKYTVYMLSQVSKLQLSYYYITHFLTNVNTVTALTDSSNC